MAVVEAFNTAEKKAINERLALCSAPESAPEVHGAEPEKPYEDVSQLMRLSRLNAPSMPVTAVSGSPEDLPSVEELEQLRMRIRAR